MGKPRFDHKELVVRIMEDKDVEGAMAHILEVTKTDPPRRRRAVFDNIRTRILKQEHYRSSEGYAELQQLCMEQSLNPTDKVKLQTLLFKPLHFIRWAQVHRSFLSDHNVQCRLRDIKIVKDPFYEFDTPENIKLLVTANLQQLVQDNHSHKVKPKEHYRFTVSEVDDMVQTATDYIQQELPWEKRANSLRLLECLCLLTGRRKWELCSTLKIRTVPDFEFQAEVQGIAKDIKSIFQEEWVKIPLLAPVSVVIRGITNLRLHPHEMGRYAVHAKLFPRLTHTHYRNLYSDKCFHMRHINKFCEDDSCSELEWRRRALHVTMSIIASRYSTMLITDERGFQEREDGMACEDGGPQIDVLEDTVRCGGQHSDQSGGHHDECLPKGDA
jgi:hypothetical protein